MSEENNTPEEETKTRDDMTPVERMKDSIQFVVDMMNSGSVDARDVYPSGRYQGD